MSDRDTVRQALYDAIDWQTSLADAYSKTAPERADALKQVKAYRAVLKRRYGRDSTPMEALADSCQSINIHDLTPKPEPNE